MKLFKDLARLIWLEHREIKLVLLYGVAFSLLNLIFPLGVQAILNNLNYGTLIQPVILVALLVFAVLGVSSVIRSFQVYIIEIIQQRIFSRITLSIGRFIPITKAGAFDAELMNRFFEIVNVQKMQYLILMDGLGTILQTFLGLLLLTFYHPYLFIFTVLFLLCLYVVVFVGGRGGVETSIAESKEKYKVAEWLEEVTRHKKIFSSLRGAKFALQRLDDSIFAYLVKREKHFKILFKQYCGTFALFVLGSVGVLILGSWLVIKGELTVGQLVAVEIVVSGITANLVKLGKYIESVYDLAASYDKLEAIFNVPHDEYSAATSLQVTSIKKISFKNVVYYHPKVHARMENSLRFASFEILENQKIAIFGKSGSGKSTLANILCGFKELEQGDYFINELSVKEFACKQLLSRFFLLEKASLFKGTILQNITLSDPQEGQERLAEIMKGFPYAEELFRLENGLSTQVYGLEGEFSDRLMTMIAFLRAIYAAPDCLVIDQTFDALHEDFSRGFIDYIHSACPTMMVVVLTSDPDILKYFSHQVHLGKS